MFDRHVGSLQALKDTPVGRLINENVERHNKKAKNTLKAYAIWAAVVYWQKDNQRLAHTQRAMTVKSLKK